MRARFLILTALAGCHDHPSKLDHVAPASDPWARTKTEANADEGFDLQGTLSKIADAIEKPGPYEAPDQSKDFAADKPHWGVMKVHGAIVEREAFSLTGGRGTELRQVIDRLRALAKEDKLVGLVLRVDALEISLPDVIELRAAMHDFRAAGKQLHCHAESAGNAM